jgi:peptidoglycan/xylan/chitin deacetylase (PgdA/CDA1 family)
MISSLAKTASAALLLAFGVAGVADGAVILMYHHVAADTPSSTSVTPERFEAHLRYLERNDFNVAPLRNVLEALDAGRPLPDRTVAITFDDGYASVLDEAMPRLERRAWPFTVFVSTHYVDEGYGGYLDWEGLRELARPGATVGNHTRTHAHLVRRLSGEREAAWSARVRVEIVYAARRIESELGAAAIDVLADPYGEFDDAVGAIVEDLGLFGLGQHSGAAGPSTPLSTVPRYPLATGFDSDEEFALRARSRALPATPIGDVPRIIERPGLRPRLRLALGEGDYRVDQLACYATAQGRMSLSALDGNPRRIEIAPVEGLGPGRTKFNCTAPSASEPGIYHWFSHQVMTLAADGEWYSE